MVILQTTKLRALRKNSVGRNDLNGLNVLNDWNLFSLLRSVMGCQRAHVGHLDHFARQLFGQFLPQGLSAGLIPKIVELVWIGGEIVEFAPTDAFVDRQAVLLGDQAAGAEVIRQSHIAAPLVLFDEH